MALANAASPVSSPVSSPVFSMDEDGGATLGMLSNVVSNTAMLKPLPLLMVHRRACTCGRGISIKTTLGAEKESMQLLPSTTTIRTQGSAVLGSNDDSMASSMTEATCSLCFA